MITINATEPDQPRFPSSCPQLFFFICTENKSLENRKLRHAMTKLSIFLLLCMHCSWQYECFYWIQIICFFSFYLNIKTFKNPKKKKKERKDLLFVHRGYILCLGYALWFYCKLQTSCQISWLEFWISKYKKRKIYLWWVFLCYIIFTFGEN